MESSSRRIAVTLVFALLLARPAVADLAFRNEWDCINQMLFNPEVLNILLAQNELDCLDNLPDPSVLFKNVESYMSEQEILLADYQRTGAVIKNFPSTHKYRVDTNTIHVKDDYHNSLFDMIDLDFKKGQRDGMKLFEQTMLADIQRNSAKTGESLNRQHQQQLEEMEEDGEKSDAEETRLRSRKLQEDNGTSDCDDEALSVAVENKRTDKADFTQTEGIEAEFKKLAAKHVQQQVSTDGQERVRKQAEVAAKEEEAKRQREEKEAEEKRKAQKDQEEEIRIREAAKKKESEQIVELRTEIAQQMQSRKEKVSRDVIARLKAVVEKGTVKGGSESSGQQTGTIATPPTDLLETSVKIGKEEKGRAKSVKSSVVIEKIENRPEFEVRESNDNILLSEEINENIDNKESADSSPDSGTSTPEPGTGAEELNKPPNESEEPVQITDNTEQAQTGPAAAVKPETPWPTVKSKVTASDFNSPAVLVKQPNKGISQTKTLLKVNNSPKPVSEVKETAQTVTIATDQQKAPDAPSQEESTPKETEPVDSPAQPKTPEEPIQESEVAEKQPIESPADSKETQTEAAHVDNDLKDVFVDTGAEEEVKAPEASNSKSGDEDEGDETGESSASDGSKKSKTKVSKSDNPEEENVFESLADYVGSGYDANKYIGPQRPPILLTDPESFAVVSGMEVGNKITAQGYKARRTVFALQKLAARRQLAAAQMTRVETLTAVFRSFMLLHKCVQRALEFCKPNKQKLLATCESSSEGSCQFEDFRAVRKCHADEQLLNDRCYRNCPPGFIDFKTLCLKPNYQQRIVKAYINDQLDQSEERWGETIVATSCQHKNHLLRPVGPFFCRMTCPMGFKDFGIYCRKPVRFANQPVFFFDEQTAGK